MAAHAPDARSIFRTPSGGEDDAALLALLGTSQPALEVGPEHHLAKAGGDTKIAIGMSGSSVQVSWPMVFWLQLRSCDISALAGLKCNWVSRPAALSRWMAHLIAVGDLEPFKATHEGELATWVVNAAKSGPKFKLQPSDIITMEALSTGTWLDEAMTADFTSADNSGRALAQLREVAMRWTNNAGANKAKQVLNQTIYSLERVTGDIQNIPKESR